MWTRIKNQQWALWLIGAPIVFGIVAMMFGNFAMSADERRVETTTLIVKSFGRQLEAYKTICGSYPTSEQGLRALFTEEKVAPICAKWDGAPWKGVSQDAWGTPVAYESDGVTFEVKSFGADKAAGGEGLSRDLIVRDSSR